MSIMNHVQLVKSLADSINSESHFVFTEISLDSYINSPGIADVLTVRRAVTNIEVVIYEVKASRGDLRADLRSRKWKRYLPFCSRLVFAVGDGFEYKDVLTDMPEVGIRKYNSAKNTWVTLRQGQSQCQNPLSPQLAIKLLLRMDSHEDRRIRGLRRHEHLMQLAAAGCEYESSVKKRLETMGLLRSHRNGQGNS